MQQAGWVWEGLAFDPGVEPTIYGVGDGMTYFGLDQAVFIFHPNTEINFAKLSHARRMIAEISKWYWYETRTQENRFAFAQTIDPSPDRVTAEARNVSELSMQFPNCVGAYIDDTHAILGHQDYTPDVPARIKRALCSVNPELELSIVVYTHELERERWEPWLEHVDVISLWVWESRCLGETDRYIEQCREIFPGKRINMGVYMRDYSIPAPVSLGMLEAELSAIERHVARRTLDGYSILGTCLIDQHPNVAAFIREFVRGS